MALWEGGSTDQFQKMTISASGNSSVCLTCLPSSSPGTVGNQMLDIWASSSKVNDIQGQWEN